MERYHQYQYHSGWNVWVHPLWNALLNNPAYYYYYTAKAALLNQVLDNFHNFTAWNVHHQPGFIKLRLLKRPQGLLYSQIAYMA
jgi:hypothetical protein